MTSARKREAAIAIALHFFCAASVLLVLAGPLGLPDSVVVPAFLGWCAAGAIVVVLSVQLSRAEDVRFGRVVRRAFNSLASLVGWFG